ncbi:MAG: TonB-dependent receptor [Chlorobi bacterium]|nr:TonB-dependent receptor [Chlorobiota bacterium]
MKKPGSFLILLLLTFSSFIYAQEKVISGVVKDVKTGDVLPFVNVAVKGTTTGTVTDNDGKFTLKIPDDNVQLSFSYVGYENLNVPVDGKSFLEVKMHSVMEKLEEVVVIGYGVQKKSDLSGAVASVKTEDLEDIVATDVVSSLKGRAAGVVISSTTGIPGDENANKVRIRGTSSLTASNDPLYVIDGVSGNINNINPNDIESIEILKDASSTAIYGAAGANGVILITTKSGSKGKPKVTFSMQLGIQSKPESIDLLSSEQEYELLKELNADNPGFFDIFSDYNYNDRENPGSSRIDTTNWANVDWQDEIMQNSTFQEYNLSISGGGEKTTYMLSALYRDNEGILKTASAEQYGFRLNLDTKVSKKFNIKSNINLSRRESNPVQDNTEGWNGALINAAFTYPNFIPIYDPDVPDEFFVNPIRPQFDNPEAWIRGKDQESTITSVTGLLQFKWDVAKGLTFLSDNSVSYSGSNSSTWLNPYDTYVGRNARGSLETKFSESLGYGTQNTLTWMKSYGDHDITAMAGFQISRGTGRGSILKGYGFANDMIKEIQAAENVSGSTYHSDDISAAYFGRINYSYAGKYLAQFNMRADGSSRFGKNNRWGQFPSASVAWKISDESFFKDNIQFINFLKIRFGYGQSGNKPPGNFMYMDLYGTSHTDAEVADAAYPIDLTDALTAGYSIMRLENPDLRWETTEEINLGIDMHMFSNRIILNVDLYNRDAYDLLYIFEPPVTYYDYNASGGTYGGLLMNIGNTNNKGIEISLSTRNLTGIFKWDTDITFAYNENNVESLGDDASVNYSERQVIAPGYPINAFWGYQVDRILQESDFDADGNLLDDIPDQPNVRPGDIKFKDNNGDGVVNEDDKVYLGDPTPPVTYGMTNTFRYSNFDLSIFIQGVQGNKIWNMTRESTEGMLNNLQQFATVLDRWTPENTDTDMPRAVLGDPAQNTRLSDRYVEDGSYLRVKDVVLGYNFPDRILSSLNMQSLRVYLSAQNLFTFTDYSGYDPEVRAVDYSGYPQNRTFIFGLNVTF